MSDHIPGEDVGLEDGEGEPEKQRLHRRDTPHHLKNKRINQQQVWKSGKIYILILDRTICNMYTASDAIQIGFFLPF